jgi:hypothetical protein
MACSTETQRRYEWPQKLSGLVEPNRSFLGGPRLGCREIADTRLA